MLWLWDADLCHNHDHTGAVPSIISIKSWVCLQQASNACRCHGPHPNPVEGFNTRIKKHVSAVQCFLMTLDHGCIFFACQGEPGVPGQKVSSAKLQLQLLSPEMQSAQMWLWNMSITSTHLEIVDTQMQFQSEILPETPVLVSAGRSRWSGPLWTWWPKGTVARLTFWVLTNGCRWRFLYFLLKQAFNGWKCSFKSRELCVLEPRWGQDMRKSRCRGFSQP